MPKNHITQLNNPIKYCIICNNELVIDNNWTIGRKTRHIYICKDCHNKRNKIWKKLNPKSQNEWVENNREKVNATNRKYKRTPKGKVSVRKNAAKRRGYGGTELFPNPFDDNVSIRWHHVSNELIVAIPTDLHVLYSGFKYHRELVMNVVNQIYIEGDLFDY